MRLKVKYLILLIATTTTLNVVKNKIPSLVIESKKLSDTQNKFSLRNIFLYKYFKIIYYLCQLKDTLNILLAVHGLNRGNLMEFQEKILKT